MYHCWEGLFAFQSILGDKRVSILPVLCSNARTVGVSWKVVEGDALTEVHSTLIKCFPIQ